jgi:hypothetical protein
MMILPRQARDKHRETTPKKARFVEDQRPPSGTKQTVFVPTL